MRGQGQLDTATLYIQKQLAESIDWEETKKHQTWRGAPQNFQRLPDGRYPPGTVDFSPCWFQARKEVSNLYYHVLVIYTNPQRLVDQMGPSTSLFGENIRLWLTEITDTENDINLILSLIAPDLYHAGHEAMDQIHSSNPHPLVKSWPSVFSGISVISNRKTIAHRDQGGWPACFDILLACGDYSDAKFELPDVGGRFLYTPGTVVAVCGKVLRHAVYGWRGGDRVCYAHFMRDNVHNRLGVKRSGWSSLHRYRAAMSDKFLGRLGKLYMG